jgi:ankyrin repeat protein
MSKFPLHYAAANTTTAECTIALIQYGANVDVQDIVGLTPLIWSCINTRDNYSNLAALLECSNLELADANGRTALFHAASAGINPTRTLLDHGANVNHADDEGFTSLHQAISYNRPDVLQTLLNAGADHCIHIPATGQGILHFTACYAKLETINALLACEVSGLDGNELDNDGHTALDLLEKRIPEPTPEIFNAFRRLLIQVEDSTAHAQEGTESSTDSDGSLNWETASEG